MLEGKELEGKIGDVGSYSVDVTPDFKVDADVQAALDKDLLAAIPGALKVKLTGDFQVEVDPVAIALHYLGQSQNPIEKFIGDELAKLRAGQEVNPALAQAAAAAQPAAPAAAEAPPAPADQAAPPSA